MNQVVRDRLTRCPLCSKLPAECLEALTGSVETRRIGAGETVFHRGDAATHLFVLLEGLVALSFDDDVGTTIARIVGPGQTFGEAAICGESTYPVTAEVLEPVLLAAVPGARIRELLGGRLDIVLRMLGALSLQLRSLVNQITDLKTKSTAQRLAAYLLSLAEPDRSTAVVRLPHQKRYLARELSMQPETLSRAIARLQPLGVRPVREGAAFRIEDIAALQTFCRAAEPEGPARRDDGERDVVHRLALSDRGPSALPTACQPSARLARDTAEFRLVRTVPLFSELSEDMVATVIDDAVMVHVPKHKVLFFAGDPADAFFIVLSGAVKLFVLDDEGRECLINIIGEGASFAEAAVFAMPGYPVSAEAIEPSKLLKISRNHLIGFLKRNLSVGLCMVASLARWQLRLTEELWQLRAQTPAQRLAWLLLSLTDRTSGAATVKLHYPKFVVAARIGIRPESMSRALGRLAELGVHVESGHISIDDIERLRQFAGAS